jgi:hypothetical protein
MTQQIINVGATPNDGLGDPIRASFIKCNDNFSQLYSRAQTTPPGSAVGSPGDQAGMYAYDSTFFFYCFADYDGSSTIWAQVTQVGNISVNSILNGTSSIRIADINGSATVNINGTSNIAVFTVQGQTLNGSLSTTGNISGQYLFGDGSQLTGLPQNYGNGNVAAFLPIYSGNIAGGNLAITSAITSNTLSTTGNITGNYILGNGSQLSGLPQQYSNANVSAFMAVFGSNTISTTGTINSDIISTTGNISTTSNLNAQGIVSATGNIVTAGYFVGNFVGNVVGNIVVPGSNTQVLFNTNGNVNAVGGFTFDTNGPNLLTVLGTISSQGNVQAGNLRTAGLISATGNINGGNVIATNYTGTTVSVGGNINGGNLISAGLISATGNITGNYILGNGSQLSGLPQQYSNANVSAFMAVFGSNVISTSGNITGGNILAPGLLSITGNITSGGNISSGNLNVTSNVATGNLNVTGNIASGNIEVTTDIDVGGNVSANAYTGITVSVTGNVTGGNLKTTGAVTVGSISSAGNITGGNITGTYLIGNGSQITGLPPTYGNTNVASFMAAFGANVISTTGNITSGSLSVTNNLGVGNAISAFTYSGASISTSGNVLTGGIVSATANVTGGNLTAINNIVAVGISASGNIASTNLLATGVISATGNITGGNLSVGVGTIVTGSISTLTNLSGDIGSDSFQFRTVYAQATSAQYADLAEKYLSDSEYAIGTVVVFGGNEEITVSDQVGDERVAGVISENPAYLMNSTSTGQPVALRGKVPVRVTGPVSKGDSLVTSATPGVAVSVGRDRSYAQAVFAKALEEYQGTDETVIIAVII